MKQKTKFTRKTALFLVFAVGAALILLIALRWYSGTQLKLETREDREMFLLSLGWEINTDSETEKTIKIPENLDRIMEDYNKMQQEQGFNLAEHLGESCTQYTYEITNYPNRGNDVFVTLYIQNGRLIAGDIHSVSMDGFMHGLNMKAE